MNAAQALVASRPGDADAVRGLPTPHGGDIRSGEGGSFGLTITAPSP